MKKILIPFIGLFVLILLTPIILSKIMNSNIDKKIAKLKEEGYKIKEIKKDISYLSTKREFEVLVNEKVAKLDFNISANVVLSFKNLPSTTANFDVKLNNILKGYHFYLKTKDLKHFNLVSEDYSQDGIVINSLKGKILAKKFVTTDIVVKNIQYKDNLKIDNLKLLFTLKSKNPLSFEGEYNLSKFNFKYQDIEIKAVNAGEKFSNGFYKEYKFKDKFFADKFGVKFNNQKYAVSKLKGDLNITYDRDFSNEKISTKFEFLESQIDNKLLDGAKFDIYADMLKQFLDVKIDFDKDLYQTIINQLDPKLVKKYFKNQKVHFIFKNGRIDYAN